MGCAWVLHIGSLLPARWDVLFQEEIYRTPNGDVYRNGVLIRSGSSTVIIVDDRPQNLPPGQMKKVYGTKSAKVFAPGQQKNDRYYYDEHGKKRKMKHKKNHR